MSRQSGTSPALPNTPLESDRSGNIRDSASFSAVTPARIRIQHACDRCRMLRSKCSGGSRCSTCTKDGLICSYGDRKRERNKITREFIESAKRIARLERDRSLLIETLTQLVHNSAVGTRNISDAIGLLAKMSAGPQIQRSPGTRSPNSPNSSIISSFAEKITPDSPAMSATGKQAATASVSSPKRQGELHHVFHLDHGSGMTGYIGKMSEVSWMQRVREHLIGRPTAIGSDATPAAIDLHTAQALDLNYFMDNEDLLSVNEDEVDIEQLPPPPTALILCEAYFHAVQGAFYFIQRQSLLQLLNQTFVGSAHTTWAERRTMSLFNIVWAVGAKWLKDAELDVHGIAETHSTYYARARALGLDHRILFDHPDVQMTQAIGILAFYLMMNGSIQRAWTVLGQAIRHATALGVNVRVAADVIEDSAYADRTALAYSLYQLEVLLCEITGRPMCIHIVDYTVQIDIRAPLDETVDSSIGAASRSLWHSFLGPHRGVALNVFGGVIQWQFFMPVGSEIHPQHFSRRLALSGISEEIGAKLYSGVNTMAWFDHQRESQALHEKLQAWVETLPSELRVDYKGQPTSDPRSRLELMMYYHSVRMTLWRPCLCAITIEDESPTSARFNREGAIACLQSAFHMVDTMPSTCPHAQICQLLPWWSLLHYICQAAAVLLLALSLGSQHVQGERTRIMTALRKALDYLEILGNYSKSAHKAWHIAQCLFDKVNDCYRPNESSNIIAVGHRPWNWSKWDEMRIEVVRQTLR